MSPERRRDLLLAGFVVACLATMLVLPGWQTVPFHWIWISLTLMAGVRLWSVGWTWGVVGLVAVSTGIAMLVPGGMADEALAETTEIPLMASVYLAMVWHARRREHALERVRRASEREREFVRDAAHSLRTPLTIARGHLELVQGELTSGPARDDVDIALDELRRLTGISDRLLMLATADSPGFVATRRVDAAALVSDVAGRWEAASGRQIAGEAEGRPMVLADPERLRCALDALLENALRATEAGGEVSVAARQVGGSVLIEVADTGPGIPPAAQARIFERFARADIEEVRRGTGLGLPIVKAIVDAHGGRVELRSAPGAGATFTVRLPAVGAAEAVEPAPERAPAPA